jgi:four helix bundle protein
MPIRSYRDLEVYQRSMLVLAELHSLLLDFPSYERLELSSQIRRASKSVPLNIAEGYGRRKSDKDFKCFLSTAMGSANEVVVCLEISKLLCYAKDDICDKLIAEYDSIGKMLNVLIQRWI